MLKPSAEFHQKKMNWITMSITFEYSQNRLLMQVVQNIKRQVYITDQNILQLYFVACSLKSITCMLGVYIQST